MLPFCIAAILFGYGSLNYYLTVMWTLTILSWIIWRLNNEF